MIGCGDGAPALLWRRRQAAAAAAAKWRLTCGRVLTSSGALWGDDPVHGATCWIDRRQSVMSDCVVVTWDCREPLRRYRSPANHSHARTTNVDVVSTERNPFNRYGIEFGYVMNSAVVSPATGYWGMCPLDFQQFAVASLGLVSPGAATDGRPYFLKKI